MVLVTQQAKAHTNQPQVRKFQPNVGTFLNVKRYRRKRGNVLHVSMITIWEQSAKTSPGVPSQNQCATINKHNTDTVYNSACKHQILIN